MLHYSVFTVEGSIGELYLNWFLLWILLEIDLFYYVIQSFRGLLVCFSDFTDYRLCW